MVRYILEFTRMRQKGKGKIRNSKNMSLVFYMQLPRKVQFIWLLTLIG